MARPIKNNADYFPHDADMRNDPRVRALRRKFGIEGYGIYAMLLEFMTDSDYFEFKNDSLSIELIAGDFDIETEKLSNILNYCFTLDLFQIDAETSIVSCKSLDNRLEPLLSKRKRDRVRVIADDNTHSKVKERKEKKSKVKESKTPAILEDELWIDSIQHQIKGKNLKEGWAECYAFHSNDPISKNWEDWQWKQKLLTWLSIKKTDKKTTVKPLHDLS